jgi:hypothetical protein
VRFGAAHQRADHVVGLDTVDHDDRPAERGDRFQQGLDLRGEVFRHGLACSLVLRIDVVAEGLSLRVEHRGDIIRGEVLFQLPQHVDDAQDRAGGLARRAAELG